MNGLADEEDLRLRFDVLTKTKQPELHRYWTTRDRAANLRLFRLAAEILPRSRRGCSTRTRAGTCKDCPVPEPVLGVAIAGGEAQRREDVPARFTVYRSADNGLRV